jgi:hypothetical protein
MHRACSVIDTACTVHAVSMTPHAYVNAVLMTPHAKCDTACTINERFKRPWQPLKGITIKNIYVPRLSYPTTKNSFLPSSGCSNIGCHRQNGHYIFQLKMIELLSQDQINLGMCGNDHYNQKYIFQLKMISFYHRVKSIYGHVCNAHYNQRSKCVLCIC